MKPITRTPSVNKLLIQFKKSDEDNKNKIIGNLINNLEYEKALHLIGDQSKLSAQKNISITLLKRYTYLALIKNALMSHQSFLKIADEVVEEILIREIPQESLTAWLSVLLSNYRTARTFPKNKNILLPLKTMESSSVHLMFCLFELKQLHLRAFTDETDSRSYLEIFEHFNSLNNEQYNKFLYNARLFEWSEDELTGKINDQTFEKLFNYFEESNFKVLYGCHYNYLLGRFEYLKGNYQKALKHYETSLTLNPTALEKSYLIFAKHIIDPNSCSFKELIFLRCAPLATFSGLVSFNLFTHNTERSHHVYNNYKPYYKTLLEDDLSRNCWLYNNQNKSLNREQYLTVDPQVKYLDFYSGIFKTDKGLKIISTHKLKALKIIFGCSSFGAHEMLLIDMVYEQNFFQYESGKLRIKNLINQINKMGIHIYRKKNRYFYDFDKNNCDIIFPIDHQTRTLLAHISKTNDHFSLKTLTQNLKMKKSTASLCIQNWRKRGMIKGRNDLSRGEYEISLEVLHRVDRFFESLD